jgi:hypothetical protein
VIQLRNCRLRGTFVRFAKEEPLDGIVALADGHPRPAHGRFAARDRRERNDDEPGNERIEYGRGHNLNRQARRRQRLGGIYFCYRLAGR